MFSLLKPSHVRRLLSLIVINHGHSCLYCYRLLANIFLQISTSIETSSGVLTGTVVLTAILPGIALAINTILVDTG